MFSTVQTQVHKQLQYAATMHFLLRYRTRKYHIIVFHIKCFPESVPQMWDETVIFGVTDPHVGHVAND